MIIAFYDDCNHWYYLGIIKNKIDKKTNESNDCYAIMCVASHLV